jgi:hypothetical protein
VEVAFLSVDGLDLMVIFDAWMLCCWRDEWNLISNPAAGPRPFNLQSLVRQRYKYQAVGQVPESRS